MKLPQPFLYIIGDFGIERDLPTAQCAWPRASMNLRRTLVRLQCMRIDAALRRRGALRVLARGHLDGACVRSQLLGWQQVDRGLDFCFRTTRGVAADLRKALPCARNG